MGYAIVRKYRELLGHPLTGPAAIKIATKDKKRAYRQIPVLEDHLPYSTIAVYHPFRKKWVFGVLHGLAFGLSSAVLQFNRYPALIVAIARRWLAIPVISFFDDFKLTEPDFAANSGPQYFDKLVNAMGWLFDEDKNIPLTPIGKFLGGVEDFTQLDNDLLCVRSIPQREDQVFDILDSALQAKCLPSSIARTLLGKLIHRSSFLPGRVGRGHLQAISSRAAEKGPEWSRHLEFDLIFHRELGVLKPTRHIHLAGDTMDHIHIFTDAACSRSPPLLHFHVQLCWIIICPARSLKLGGVSVVPCPILESFGPKGTYIAEGEAFAPLLCLHHHATQLSHAHLLLFIDNMGVLSGFIKGSSSIADFGAILSAFHLRTTQLQSSAWFEHVQSKSNIADGGSRVGAACPIAGSFGISLDNFDFPQSWPTNVFDVHPSRWLSLLSD